VHGGLRGAFAFGASVEATEDVLKKHGGFYGDLTAGDDELT